MALAPCQTAVDSSGRELVEHGTTGLPVACYHDDLGRRDVPWHWHDELEAAVVTEGCAVVSAGESKRVIRAGEGFFINSGILHGCRDADNSSCRFHSVVFHPRLVGGSLDSTICHTEERISDIASRCGFQDMSYFTKSFREQLGCTPTEYRRRAECPERS